MRLYVHGSAMVGLLLAGCSNSPEESPQGSTSSPSADIAPSVSPTPVSPSPTPSLSAYPLCDEISFTLDPSLASGFTCEREPEFTIEGAFFEPEHAVTMLGDEGQGFDGAAVVLYVYPIEGHADEFPVDYVRSLASGIPPNSSESSLPLKPGGIPFSAAQTLVVQYEPKTFDESMGIRYLTEFRQDVGAPSGGSVFYTYQGVTADGKYWIAVYAPIDHQVFDDGGGDWPDWITWDQWCMQNYEECHNDIVERLNSEAPDSFVPSIEVLDDLAASVVVDA